LQLDTQEPVEDAIFAEVHGSRYTLAQGAPICRGKLFEDFGNLANTAAAEEVLNGSYLTPVTMNQQAVLDDDQAVLGLFDKYCEL
jgi:hypothetical protein